MESNAQIASMSARSQAFRYWIVQVKKDFSHALRLNPKQVEARVNLGSAMWPQGRFQAAEIFNGTLVLFLNTERLWKEGLVYLHLHKYCESLEDINAALEDFDRQGPIGNIIELVRVKNAMDKNTENNDSNRFNDNELDIIVDNRTRTLNNIKENASAL